MPLLLDPIADSVPRRVRTRVRIHRPPQARCDQAPTSTPTPCERPSIAAVTDRYFAMAMHRATLVEWPSSLDRSSAVVRSESGSSSRLATRMPSTNWRVKQRGPQEIEPLAPSRVDLRVLTGEANSVTMLILGSRMSTGQPSVARKACSSPWTHRSGRHARCGRSGAVRVPDEGISD